MADYSLQAYLDSIGWDGTRDMYGRSAQQVAYSIGESGIDGGQFGFDETAAADYFNNLVAQPVGIPVDSGMAPGGSQNYDTPTGAPVIADPVGNAGADLTGQPAWNQGQQMGGGAYQGNGGIDWNWGEPTTQQPGPAPVDIGPTQGLPGQDSPWGNPNLEGGNEQFYQQQFAKLLRQDQQFQADQAAAIAARAEAQANPQPVAPNDWSWLEGGLPNVSVGGAEPSWDWASGIERGDGTTNQELYSQISSNLTPQTRQFFQDHWSAYPEQATQTFWNSFNNPDDLMSSTGHTGAGMAAVRDVANNLYANTNASSAPVGYASPVPGLGDGRGSFGYQQGGATSYFNPMTGAWGAGGAIV
jgi:hypothetical protein